MAKLKSRRSPVADPPGGIDVVTILRLLNPTHMYRCPVDRKAHPAEAVATYPDGKAFVLVYFRGNTLVTVYEVPAKEDGIGCCWPMPGDPSVA